jgi:hypothetical protein
VCCRLDGEDLVHEGWILGGLGVVPVSTASEGNADADEER